MGISIDIGGDGGRENEGGQQHVFPTTTKARHVMRRDSRGLGSRARGGGETERKKEDPNRYVHWLRPIWIQMHSDVTSDGMTLITPGYAPPPQPLPSPMGIRS